MSDLDDSSPPPSPARSKKKHSSTATPHRLAMWSTQDPVTVLGALRGASGWDQVSRLVGWLGSGFSDCTSYRYELLAAGVSGDLADTVGDEHTSVSWDGTPVDPYTLRVTRAYRREDGEWRIVHRHADAPRSISPEPACWAALGGHIGATSLPEVIPCRPSQVRQ
jgi:ketosteroid isomerase-like protein